MSKMSDFEDEDKIKQDLSAQDATIKAVKDNIFGRRHWEITNEGPEQEEKSDKKESVMPVVTRNLATRTNILNLDSKLGKAQLINKDTVKEKQAGFYCETCECLMKDSQSYLDHINGKKHNKMLGMNMKVERVGLDRIKAKMTALKMNPEKKVSDFNDFEKKYEEELKKREEKKAKKKLKPEEVNAKIEKKLIENGLIEDSQEKEIENHGLPVSFASKKIKK